MSGYGYGTERSKALHNFKLPVDLRWGNQRFLRCMKVNSDGPISPIRRLAADDSSCYSDQRHRGGDFTQRRRAGTERHIDRDKDRERDSSSESAHGSHRVGAMPVGRQFTDDDGGIAATREKLMFDLRAQADEMKDAILKDGLKESDVSTPSPPPQPVAAAAAVSVDGEIQRPWNLRTRRAAYKTPASRLIYSSAASAATNDLSAVRKDSPKSNPVFSQSQPGPSTTADKSPCLRSGVTPDAATGCEKRPLPKFSVALSKSQIEEDFLNLVGHRPPRRPKKRPRIVQRQLDALFPGLGLTEVTPDMYKVNEAAQ